MIALLSILSARAECLLTAGGLSPGDPIVVISDGNPPNLDLWMIDGEEPDYSISAYVSPASGERVTILVADLVAGEGYVLDCDESSSAIYPSDLQVLREAEPIPKCSTVDPSGGLVGILAGLLAVRRRKS